MLFEGVHHVAIIASDYQASRHFYVDLLGFEVLGEHYQKGRDSYKLDLKAGNCAIELFAFPKAPPRPTYPEARGLRHLCFCVRDVAQTVKELSAKGICCEPVREDEYSGGRFTFFMDPDGLPLEIHEA